MKNRNPIFVYGRFRVGTGRHFLMNNALYAGKARTWRKYSLKVSTYPFVTRNSPVSQIHGEVYLVDSETLQLLDHVLQHPNGQCREKVPVELLGGNIISAWMYFQHDGPGVQIENGDFLSVSNNCSDISIQIPEDHSTLKMLA